MGALDAIMNRVGIRVSAGLKIDFSSHMEQRH
jgi:hypothetical protein